MVVQAWIVAASTGEAEAGAGGPTTEGLGSGPPDEGAGVASVSG
jgi:hypothetical protein